MTFPTAFYWKLGAVSFVMGACMELFMIKTGFYDIVTKSEAERWLEGKEERDKQRENLRQQVIRQFEERGLEVPKGLRDSQ